MPDPDPFYDVVVMVHVVGAIVGFGALLVTGVFAARARRLRPSNSEALRRYFNGRTNWAARVIYSVPVLGFALLAMGRGRFRLGEFWLLSSIGLWVIALVLAKLVIWPGERFIAASIASGGPEPARGPALNTVCVRVMAAAASEVALFVLSLVIMLDKPGR